MQLIMTFVETFHFFMLHFYVSIGLILDNAVQMVFWPETTCFGLEYLFWLPKHSEMLTANIFPGTWAVTVPLMTGEMMFTCEPLKSPGLLVCCLALPIYKSKCPQSKTWTSKMKMH